MNMKVLVCLAGFALMVTAVFAWAGNSPSEKWRKDMDPSSGRPFPHHDTDTEIAHISSITDIPIEFKSELATVFPSMAQQRIIGRIAKGITVWKTSREDGGWWHCGVYHTNQDEIDEHALRMAYHIVRASSDKRLNPWGVTGIVAIESAFDPCAIGKTPRKWAVRNKIIKQNPRSISYNARDVMTVVNHPAARERFSETGFDLGPCQLLTRYYDGPKPEMLDTAKGIAICAGEMARRGDKYRTQRPWYYWRGFRVARYRDKIERWAKRNGARTDEM